MKQNQVFQIRHDRAVKLKASEVADALSRCYPGVLGEDGKVNIKEVPMGPHTLGSLSHK